METSTSLVLGALGGEQTFGGQAAALLLAAYPEFGSVEYYDDAGSMMQAVSEGNIFAACVPEQTARTGFHLRSQRRVAPPTSPRYVVAEIAHAYHCSLLVKPGTPLERIRRVIGHTGSVSQSRPWLEAHLSDAEVEIIDTNSLGAAQTVLDSDGSVASVGTSDAAGRVGLTELVRDIDEGSVGNYWALSETPRFAEEPTSVVLTGRFVGDGRLGTLIGAVLQHGWSLQTVFSETTGRALYEYDYVLRFGGRGRLDGLQRLVGDYPEARLTGAFVTRDASS